MTLSLEQGLEQARADRSYASFYGIARALGLLKGTEQMSPALLRLPGALPTTDGGAGVRVLHQPRLPIRVALLGTSTLEPFRPYLMVQLLLSGFLPSVSVGAWGQYKQELRSPDSSLVRSEPQVVMLVLGARELLGDLYDYPLGTVAERQSRLDELLAALNEDVALLLEHTQARVVLQTLVPPLRPWLGLLDAKEPLGSTALVRHLNQGLEALAQRYPRVYLFDLAGTLARVGLELAMPEKKRLLARVSIDRPAIPAVCQGWDRLCRAFFRPPRKVLVLDLDNTLWGGVVGEDGPGGIQLGPDAPGSCYLELQRVAWGLSQRGILLAICSKNNWLEVQDVLQNHPWMKLREGDFAAIRCNWQEKALNLREIAQELNLGLDALVFVDDNPVERAKIREALPEVWVVDLPSEPAEYATTLAELPEFDASVLTDEDRTRGQLYAIRRQTEALRERSGSLEAFLQQLETHVTIEPMSRHTLGRTVQLLAKTNQLNVTTRRHSDADLSRLEAEGARIFSVGLQDRFGDQGQVGVLILQPEEGGSAQAGPRTTTLCIESLVLSCRVLGRGVEAAVLAFADQCARALGTETLVGPLRYTKKNVPARALYATAGFRLEHEDAEGQAWVYPSTCPPLQVPGWVTLVSGQV